MIRDTKLLLAGNNAPERILEGLKLQGSNRITASIGKFGSGEPFVELFWEDKNNSRTNRALLENANVIIVQSCGSGIDGSSVSDNVMHLKLMAQTLKKYGAGTVTAVVPFPAFERQDENKDPHRFTSIYAQEFPRELAFAGIDRIITTAPHSAKANQYWKEVFGNNHVAISSADIFDFDLECRFSDSELEVIFGAPDGGNKPQDMAQIEARRFAAKYFHYTDSDNVSDSFMFRISKEHTGMSDTKITNFDGDVNGKHAVLIDDMTDSGGTTINAATLLKSKGAKIVTVYLGHGILSGNAIENLLTAKAPDGSVAIDKLIISDSFPNIEQKLSIYANQFPNIRDRIEVVSSSNAIVAAIDELEKTPFKPSPYQQMLAGFNAKTRG